MAEKIEQLIVPIVASSPERGGARWRLLGTAFFIGSSGAFVTAWHAVEDYINPAKAQGDDVFLVPSLDSRAVFPVNDLVRPNKYADIAVGRSGFNVTSPLSLSTERISFGKSVVALGYPNYLFSNSNDLKSYKAPIRFMRGYIQSDIWHSDIWPYETLQHAPNGPVDYFELSFSVPPGASGCPLMLEGTTTVIGVCVGNAESMSYFKVPKEKEGEFVEVYEKDRIGIAHMSNTVASLSVPWSAGKPLSEIE